MQVELAKARDIFGFDAQTPAAGVDPARVTLPGHALDAQRLEQARHQIFHQRPADHLLHDGRMHVAFIASNQTTGGNSGSPVMNANGELIGINFDRNWEGTMSDLMYDPDQCRNIVLDIRYCLFIIDKFAGAKHLIKEMTIVE
ncbi:MAG: S46 family peptidase [Bacteroidota bacterium]